MRRTAAERFRSDLLTVSDLVGEAIKDSKLGDVEDGLALYSQLVRSVLEMRAKYERALNTAAPASWLNPNGREMEWLHEDLRAFIDRAWRIVDPDVLHQIALFLSRLLPTLRQGEQLHAHQDVLNLAGRFYFRALNNETAIDGDDRSTIGRSLLGHIRSYAEYQLYLNEPAELDDGAYFLQVVRFFFTCTRMAIDVRGLAIDVKRIRVEGTLVESKNLLGKVDRRYRGDETTDRTSLRAVQTYAAGFLLGLAAYAMLLRERGRLNNVECAALLGPIVTELRQFPIEEAMHAALRENSNYPWSSWEMELWPDGVNGGAIGALEGWIRRVSAVELARRGRPARATVSGIAESFGAEHLLRRLAEGLTEISLQEWVREVYPEIPDNSHFATYAAELIGAAEEMAQEEKDEQALIPLDPSRIDEFAAEVEATWSKPTTLRGDLGVLPETDETASHWFGFSQLFSRVFFIASDVMADPADLGRNLGSGIVEGETSAILEVLDGLPTVESTAAELTRNVSAALDRLRRQGFNPTVIVVSSWSAMRTLSGDAWHSETEKGQFESASVELEYANHPATCFVVDLSQAVRIQRWRAPRLDGDDDDVHYLAADRLAVSVRGVSAQLAAELLAKNPDLGKDQAGTALAPDEAVRRLTHNVHVRCWTSFEVSSGASSAGVAFRLPDDY